jgi:hypothetical protein
MRILPLIVLGLTLAVAPLRAQEGTRSPHGDLAEPCTNCHAPDRWTPARISRSFEHARTGFALAGAHAQTSCRGCHATLDFRRTPSSCSACHTDVHRGELGADCARCHTPRSFLDRSAMTRAHQLTRFPLTGTHLAADCESCHTPAAQGRLTFVNRSVECVQCHGDAYRAAKAPDHLAGGFPTDCSQCHSTATWPGARFNHAVTRFPLTGAHRAVSCQECHGDGVFRGKTTTCVSCHQADFDGTTDPGHRAARFPTDCTLCHTTTAWGPASFDHTATAFPLTGAHIATSCQECHGDGQYAGTSTTCVSCHQAAYDATTDPNHRAAGFPTDCADCHGTSTWDGASFDHDASFFPIYSGNHRGEWASCSTCHTNPSSFQSFTCLSCHEHSQSETASNHRDVSGYRYDSQACYSCHPRGSED